MSHRLVLLNIVFLALVIVGIARLRHDAVAFSGGHRVEQIQPETDKPLPKTAPAASAPVRQEWADISTHNPFSFDRNDVTLVITPPAPQQPRRPKPILLGTMMIGADRIAMLNPGDSTNRASQAVRVGEVFDTWKVTEIGDKSVKVEWENTKESLILNDPTAQVARDMGKTGGVNATPQPPVQVSPLAVPTSPSAAPTPAASAAPSQLPLSPNGKKQIVVPTPFGPKIMEDPNQ
jgi:hypothetical protein